MAKYKFYAKQYVAFYSPDAKVVNGKIVDENKIEKWGVTISEIDEIFRIVKYETERFIVKGLEEKVAKVVARELNRTDVDPARCLNSRAEWAGFGEPIDPERTQRLIIANEIRELREMLKAELSDFRVYAGAIELTLGSSNKVLRGVNESLMSLTDAINKFKIVADVAPLSGIENKLEEVATSVKDLKDFKSTETPLKKVTRGKRAKK